MPLQKCFKGHGFQYDGRPSFLVCNALFTVALPRVAGKCLQTNPSFPFKYHCSKILSNQCKNTQFALVTDHSHWVMDHSLGLEDWDFCNHFLSDSHQLPRTAPSYFENTHFSFTSHTGLQTGTLDYQRTSLQVCVTNYSM